MKEWGDRENEDLAVFLAGDFNSFPDREAYLAMTKSGLMRDIWDLVELERRAVVIARPLNFSLRRVSRSKGGSTLFGLGQRRQST